MQYVEFYFPGISLIGKHEKIVQNRDPDLARPYPYFAYSFRFFEKDAEGNKINFSDFYYIGKEYSADEYKRSYPQGEDFGSSRIVKLTTGNFIPLNENDVVILA